MQKLNNEVGFIYGNLLDFPYGITSIAQCCNTAHVMDEGLSKKISDRYSEVKVANEEAVKQGFNILGEFSVAEVKVNKKKKGKIFNLYTNDDISFGRDVNYEALYRNLLLLRNRLNFLNEKCLGIPYEMGSETSHGSWKIVYAMIEHLFAGPQAYFDTYIVKCKNEK
jgi:hypothetical protein